MTSTIGQFTGLYDKNGKEIYEGDIVIINKDIAEIFRIKPKGMIAYLEGMFYVKYPDESFNMLQSLTALSSIDYKFRGEVIRKYL